mgnify:CR=1 FL=1
MLTFLHNTYVGIKKKSSIALIYSRLKYSSMYGICFETKKLKFEEEFNEKKISTANNKDHLTKSSFNEMDSNLDGQIDLREFRRACDRHNYIIFKYLKNFAIMLADIKAFNF